MNNVSPYVSQLRQPSCLKIGYFADGPWSHGTLDILTKDPDIEIVFICARFSGTDDYLRLMASQLDIDFLLHRDVNDPIFVSILASYDADLFVSMSFDQILKSSIYQLPRFGTINCHAGNLPFYRGRNVLNWVLINDEPMFGISVHYIDDGVDTGDIILKKCFPINDSDTYLSLLHTAYAECPKLLYKSIKMIQDGSVVRIPQDSIAQAPLICTRRVLGDEQLDWSMSSREIFNFVRALSTPGPIALTFIDSQPVKVDIVELIPDAPIYKGIPGSILAIYQNKFLVKTGDSYVKLALYHAPFKLRVGQRFS